MAAGVKEYEILAVQDRRTSKVCKEQDGKIYKFNKMEVGVNYPPFHPNCRTTIIPVLED
jgi:SPP1 gp7 family putative phage head morphogenesis protein